MCSIVVIVKEVIFSGALIIRNNLRDCFSNFIGDYLCGTEKERNLLN